MLFSNRNEFLRDSSGIEPIAPNIRNEIVSESGITRSSSRLERKKLIKPHESPRISKKSIRGDSGDSWPVWNRGIRKIIKNYIKFSYITIKNTFLCLGCSKELSQRDSSFEHSNQMFNCWLYEKNQKIYL